MLVCSVNEFDVGSGNVILAQNFSGSFGKWIRGSRGALNVTLFGQGDICHCPFLEFIGILQLAQGNSAVIFKSKANGNIIIGKLQSGLGWGFFVCMCMM